MADTLPMYVYVGKLYQALAKRRPYVTYNRDESHAGVVVAAGFRYAKEDIEILSHRLDSDVYGRVVREASETFLEKPGTKLSVLVETDIDKDHPMRELSRAYPAVEIRRVPKSLQKLYKCNFMTMDKFGYRFEPDRDSCNATVVVYDEDHLGLLRVLRQLFASLRERSAVLN